VRLGAEKDEPVEGGEGGGKHLGGGGDVMVQVKSACGPQLLAVVRPETGEGVGVDVEGGAVLA